MKNITKIKCPDTNLKNYECNPQKYDGIIHALLNEISEIKYQRKKDKISRIHHINFYCCPIWALLMLSLCDWCSM